MFYGRYLTIIDANNKDLLLGYYILQDIVATIFKN